MGEEQPLTLEALQAQLSMLAKSHEASVASLDELRQGQAAVLAEVRSATASVGELREEQRLLAAKLEANGVDGVLQTVRELRDDIQRRPDSSAIDALLQLKLDKKGGDARLRELAAAREEVEDRLRSAEAAIDALRQQTNSRRRAVEVEMLSMNEKLALIAQNSAAPMHRAFGVSVGNASHGRGASQVAKLTDYALGSGNSRCGNAGVGRCRPSSASVAPARSAVAAAEAEGAVVSVKDSVGAIRLQERARSRSPPRGPSSPGAVVSDRALVAAAEAAEVAPPAPAMAGGGGAAEAAAEQTTGPPAPPSTHGAGRTGVRGSRPLTAGGRGSRPPPPQLQQQRPQSARGRAKPAADAPAAPKTGEPPAAPTAAPRTTATTPAAAPSPAAAAVEAAVALARSTPPTLNVSDLVVNSEGISGWGESSGLSMAARPASGFRPTVPLRGAASDKDRPPPGGLTRPGVTLPSRVAPGRSGFELPMSSPRVERGRRCRRRWHAEVGAPWAARGGGRGWGGAGGFGRIDGSPLTPPCAVCFATQDASLRPGRAARHARRETPPLRPIRARARAPAGRTSRRSRCR